MYEKIVVVMGYQGTAFKQITLSDNYLSTPNLSKQCEIFTGCNLLWKYNLDNLDQRRVEDLMLKSNDCAVIASPEILEHTTFETVLHSCDITSDYTKTYENKLSVVGQFIHETSNHSYLPSNNLLRNLQPIGLSQETASTDEFCTVLPSHHKVSVLTLGNNTTGNKCYFSLPLNRVYYLNEAVKDGGTYVVYIVTGPYNDILTSRHLMTQTTANTPRMLSKFNLLTNAIANQNFSIFQNHLLRQKQCSVFFLARREREQESILAELATVCMQNSKFIHFLPDASERTVSCLRLGEITITSGS